MNFLLQTSFARESKQQLAGCYMASFFKMDLSFRTNNEELKDGINKCYEINSQLNSIPQYFISRSRFKRSFKDTPQLVRLLLDHFLAKNWSEYHNESYQKFLSDLLLTIIKYSSSFPRKLQTFLPEMISQDYLNNIDTLEGIHNYMKFMIPNHYLSASVDYNLGEALENYSVLENDFRIIYQSLMAKQIKRHKILSLN